MFAVCAWLALLGASAVRAQEGAAPPGPRNQGRRAGEIARLFDAYALMQAQETLGLDDAQYARFVGRFRTLLEVRQKHQASRGRIIQELSRLTRGDGPVDETALRDRMRALDEADAQARTETAAALVAVDELLTLLQRARFRVLEQQLERRKWELMTRARQAGRGAPGEPPPAGRPVVPQ